MPTFSYLITPTQGDSKKLLEELNRLEFSEAIPADNLELIILVTETPDNQSEELLQGHLKHLKYIQDISMTYGHVGKQHQNH